MEEILHQAELLEKEYDWLGVGRLYEKALKLLPEDDFSRKGEIYERLGYAFYRAAFQVESNDQFRQRLFQAIPEYEKAKEHYGRLDEPLKTPRTLRCDAMTTLMGYWLAEKVSEKKKLLDECWESTKRSLEAFKAGNALEYGKTFNELSESVDLGFHFHETFQPREKIIREAVELGECAIKLLSSLGDHCELSRAYAKTALYTAIFCYYYASLEDREKRSQEAANYWLKAKEISEETAMLELPSILFGCGPGGYWGDGTDDALKNFEKALEYSRKTRDKFFIGRALDLLAYHSAWSVGTTEDPDENKVRQKKAVQQAEDAKHQYLTIAFTSPRGGVNWAEGTYLWYYLDQTGRETDLSRKRELLGKALEIAPDVLKRAEKSGYPYTVGEVHTMFARILFLLANVEANSEEKKRLLEKALTHSEESVAICEQVEPLAYWDLGMLRSLPIATRRELADLTKEPETRKNMLQKILLDSEDALGLCIKGLTSYEREAARLPLLSPIAFWEVYNGNLSYHLYELTSDKEYLKRGIQTFQRAIEAYQKTNQTSRLAESFWKIAQTYDALGEHMKAADNFVYASKGYSSAAERIPQLKSFYEDHALYMQAWSEIEKARHHHEQQEYGLAKEYFEKAAELHKPLKRWSYLEPNYSAWARVEDAEELSRKEQCEEAIKAFECASKLFLETKKSVQAQLSKIEDNDEKQMATGVIKTSGLRKEYCDARIALEEAKILDKKGDHFASSRKYGTAAETFQKICQTLESEEERKEFRSIISLSRAWEKMMLGDAKASPEMYSEASALFEQASKESNTETAVFLALGHSLFCRALEAGTRFAEMKEQALYAAFMENLENASNYYVRAGYRTDSEYAKATRLLFDAYVHMDKAQKEVDPEKKTKLYALADRILQTSAGSFMKAEHPEKREQVLRLIDKVKEEQELALSLSDVLHAPSIVSATTVFASPTPTHEQAVGSERFEHADIQANLIARQKELKVGENLNIELELVNAGKGSALLTKVTEIIPKGFEVAEKPETCRIEDSYINLKGKRLDPLKTEEVKLVLKPTVQGTFSLKPTVLYLDENGKYKSHEPEPVTIVVKELGIKGWLKGER
jgi:tetratricopeptide (TPR) repeat protein